MAAEKFVQNSRHMYLRDEPHTAHILLELLYLKRLRPLRANETTTTTNATATNTSVIKTPESSIVAKAKNNPEERALLLTKDEGNETGTYAEFGSLLQLQLMDEKKTKRLEIFLKVIEKSERVMMNRKNEEVTLIKFQPVLKHPFSWYLYKKTKKL